MLTIMLIGHLLTTRKVQADQSAEAEERGEVEDKKQVLCHAEGVCVRCALCALGKRTIGSAFGAVCMCVCVNPLETFVARERRSPGACAGELVQPRG